MVVSFDNIVAVCDPTEGDTDGLHRAMMLAHADDAQLTALAIKDCESDIAALSRYAHIDRETIETGMLDELRSRLAETVQPLVDGRAIDLEARIGRPFRAIIGDVLDHNRDLVIKMAEPFDGTHRYLFTSTDQHLIRKCPCPVWLAMPDAANPPKNVLAAIDIDDEGEADATQAPLNRRIIDTALHVAALSGATLHVSHVWEAPGEDLVRRWSNEADDVRRYLDDVEQQRRAVMDGLIAAARAEATGKAVDVPIVQHLGRGRPRDVIPAHVQTIGIDLLVIGTLARSGVPGLIIGNTAEDVLNAVECSVLTVKPPGYVSPLASS